MRKHNLRNVGRSARQSPQLDGLYSEQIERPIRKRRADLREVRLSGTITAPQDWRAEVRIVDDKVDAAVRRIGFDEKQRRALGDRLIDHPLESLVPQSRVGHFFNARFDPRNGPKGVEGEPIREDARCQERAPTKAASLMWRSCLQTANISLVVTARISSNSGPVSKT